MNMMFSRCGPRRVVRDAAPRFFAYDAEAKVEKLDPTGTTPIQNKFMSDARARWNKLRAVVPTMISVRTDAAKTIEHHALTGQDSVRAFQKHFDTAVKMIVVGNGSWMTSYVRAAGDLATLKAATTPKVDRIPPLLTLVHTELQGIAEQVSQQAVRAFTNGLMQRQTPTQIANAIKTIIDKTAIGKTEMLVSFILVRAYNAVILDCYRAAGVPLVGVAAEHRVLSTESLSDAASTKKKGKVKKAKGKVRPSPKPKAKKTKPKDLVEVLTAGDEKVCQQCEDISNEGPYTLKEAEGLIPAHIRCRCAFVPWHDARYGKVEHEDAQLWAFDVDYDEKKHPRAPDGKWTHGNGYVTAYHGTTLKVWDKVKKSGLKVTKQRSFGDSDLYKDDRGRAVFVANSFKTADWYARNRTFTKGGTPVIIEMRIPKAEWDNFHKDELHEGRGAAYTTKTIPAKWLVGAMGSKFNYQNGYTDGLPDYVTAYLVLDSAEWDEPPVNDSATHIAAGVMYLDPQGRALFLKRNGTGDQPGTWAFPGGAVEPGETVQQAARRETMEEIGRAPDAMVQVDRRETNGVDFTTYSADVDRMFAPTLNEEHSDWTWRRLDDPPQPLHPGVQATVGVAVIGDDFEESLHPRGKDGKWIKKGTPEYEAAVKKLKAEIDEHNSNNPGSKYIEHKQNAFGQEKLIAPSEVLMKTKQLIEKHGFEHSSKPNPDQPEVTFTLGNKFEKSATPAGGDDHKFLDMNKMTKTGGKMGSNEGGTYSEDVTGMKYYIKKPETTDHVNNELIAAKLYNLAGAKTLHYVPVKGGNHVATELEDLAKKNVSDLNADERHEAQKDFAVHAWLANWDAAGTGGDNIGVRHNGDVVTLDTGGSLKYRAQGTPKGDAFGDVVTETSTLRDHNSNPDAAGLYGNMTNQQIVDSIKRVTAISNSQIEDTVLANGGDGALAAKLINRKIDLQKQAIKLTTAPEQPSSVAPSATVIPIKTPGDVGIEAAKEEAKVFKTKQEHAKHLLMKGTTSDELKKALNWPSIGVPATAKSLGLKLEKTKLPGGAFFYKGTPMDADEIKEANKAVVLPGPGAKPAEPEGLKTIDTHAGNFKKGMESIGLHAGVDYDMVHGSIETHFKPGDETAGKTMAQVAKWHPNVTVNPDGSYSAMHVKPFDSDEPKVKLHEDPAVDKFAHALTGKGIGYSTQDVKGNNPGTFVTLAHPKDVTSASALLHEHPSVEKLSAHEFFVPAVQSVGDPAPKPTYGVPLVPSAAPKSASYTESELTKAKKTTPLSAQYVPGAIAGNPQSDKLIAEFNAKWAGKEIAQSPHLVEQKVDEFKQLVENMKPIAAAHQDFEQKSIAQKQIAAAAAAAKKAKEQQDFIDNLHEQPEEDQRKYWLNKISSEDNYLKQGEHILNSGHYAGDDLKAAGVTPAEIGFIRAFTGPYSHVNEEMRAGFMNDQTFAFKHIMNEALAKMPKYTGGTVWRKIQLTHDQQAKYVPGQLVHWAAFSSTAKNPDTWSGNTHFTINKVKSGVDVESISSNPSEAEVIMPADTYYKVISKKQVHGDTHITLEEVIPFGSKKKKVA